MACRVSTPWARESSPNINKIVLKLMDTVIQNLWSCITLDGLRGQGTNVNIYASQKDITANENLLLSVIFEC